MAIVDELVRQVTERARAAAEARAAAQAERHRNRQENDLYVTGGVNWDGFGLEHLIKMVAERASPGQLDALAGEWRRHGSSIVKTSEDLQRSLGTLMQYWSGESAEGAERLVTRNATWVGELGDTAQQMADPVEDAGGALRSAQDTMPGKPSNPWYATAGGGALAGFAVGGPVGAAFGAAIGGIASAFGFGSSKRKLKRKAVQTMQRYEGALLGIDQTTPQFGLPSNGSDPGLNPIRNQPPGVGTPTPGPTPPGSDGSIATRPGLGGSISTLPAFADGPGARWQGLTGFPPGGGGLGPGTGAGTGTGIPGLGGFPPGFSRGAGGGAGRGAGSGAFPPGGAGRGGADSERRARAGRGAGAMGPYGPGAGRGGADSERRGRGGRTAAAGYGGGRGAAGRGAAGAGYGAGMPGSRNKSGEDREHRPRGRFANTGIGGAGGYGPIGAGAGRPREEEDGEHRRRFPVEEDPFSTDQKAAPPVIGL